MHSRNSGTTGVILTKFTRVRGERDEVERQAKARSQ